MMDDLQHPEHTGHELAVGDVTLYYGIYGVASGIPLFVLNGGPGFDHTYLEVSAVWQELAKRRPVVFYDQRGNGRSSHLTRGQSAVGGSSRGTRTASRALVDLFICPANLLQTRLEQPSVDRILGGQELLLARS